MRAIILSDSHGDTASCRHVAQAVENADMIIHLGDIERDADYLRSICSNIPVYSVMGNNEFFRTGALQSVVQFGAFRLFICHGHTYSVNHGTQLIENAARKEKCSAALFGHTHKAICKKENGFLILNPGSVRYPREGAASFAVLEINTEKGKPSLEGVIVDWIL